MVIRIAGDCKVAGIKTVQPHNVDRIIATSTGSLNGDGSATYISDCCPQCGIDQ